MLALLLAFSNHPDKEWIVIIAVAILALLAYGLSDYLAKKSRNIAAFFLFFSLGSALVGLGAWHAWPATSSNNEFTLTKLMWAHPTMHSQMPCDKTATQRPLPDGTCEILLPLGIFGTPLYAEMTFSNSSDLYVEDVSWHGGVVVADDLNDAVEDELFVKLTNRQFATWPKETLIKSSLSTGNIDKFVPA
jgi:hypothetical protein